MCKMYSYLFVFLFVCALPSIYSEDITRHELVLICNENDHKFMGHGVVIRWDDLDEEPLTDAEYTIKREEAIDCNITLEIDPEGFSGLALMSALHFRSTGFKVIAGGGATGTGTSVESCGDTYLQLYDPADSDEPVWTFCSDNRRPAHYESTSTTLMLRLVVNFTEYEVDNVTQSLPRVFFVIDFTTYAHDCDVDKFDDLLKCERSDRCIHTDVVCDRFAARNCWSPSTGWDISDQQSGWPAYCTEDPLAYLLPLWILLGLLGAALLAGILYWLFWRPGWVPWRCARLRNYTCSQSCCKRGKCSTWCSESSATNCCRSGPANAYSDSGAGMSGAGGKGGGINGHLIQNGAGGGWTKFFAGDGFHLSESRY